LTDLLTWLSTLLQGGAALALAAAFLWGVASMVLSPCHLASIPLLVTFLNGQGKLTTGRGVLLSSLFAAGLLVTIALVGMLTAAAGLMVGNLGPAINWAVAAVFLLVGLHLLGVVPLPQFEPATVQFRQHGTMAAFLLGLFFGLALGPCTFAFMAPVLGVSFQAASTSPTFAAALLVAYGIGHCSIIVAAGSAIGRVQSYLDWSERSGGAGRLRAACGIALLIAGFCLLATG
jgi:cytochrome c-type biogenesis protein